jgi:hypothetical protein
VETKITKLVYFRVELALFSLQEAQFFYFLRLAGFKNGRMQTSLSTCFMRSCSPG